MTVLEITRGLQETSALINDLERTLARYPTDRGAILSLKSLKKQQQQIEEQLVEATSRVGLDICSYRFVGSGALVANNVFATFVQFQKLLAVAYAAKRTGVPRITSAVGKDDRLATALEFSCALAGSLNLVFTLPNERLLFGESDIDEAMASIFSMAKSQDTKSIRSYAQSLGIAVVRELYRWSELHAEYELGADIDWRRGKSVRYSLFVQPQEFSQLQSVIDETSSESVEQMKVRGVLVGADVSTRRFHFAPFSGREIRGSFSDAIAERTIHLPGKYIAVITKTTVVKYSTEEERVEYVLEKISPLR